jgi:hypothetical protein
MRLLRMTKMYEIVILGVDQNATWKIGVLPDLNQYRKPGVYMAALYAPGNDEHGVRAKLLDYKYWGL